MEQGEDPEVFCREVWPDLVRALSLMCRDDALGQDAAQEALATVVARWARVSRMASPKGYAYRVGVNAAKDALRRRAREQRPAVSVQSAATTRPSVPDDEAVADRLALADALRRLPPRQRLAVALRYLGDLSVSDTAAAMRCRPGTVRALCHQATQSLQASPDLAWHPSSTAPTATAAEVQPNV